MKKHFFTALTGIVLFMACSKVNEDPSFSPLLEQRGNDNYKIWKLATIDNKWDYTLSDGFQSDGFQTINYVFSCTRPVGRVIKGTNTLEENGVVLWDNEGSMSYNDNFMIVKEQAQEFGENVIRTFHYDADFKWNGMTTEINGEIKEDKIEIGPGGQVKSYTSNGVRNEYIWKADNLIKTNTYIESTAELSSIQRSSVYNLMGNYKISKEQIKKYILRSFKENVKLQRSSSQLRGKKTSEWILVFVDEQKFDTKVVQPYSSVAKGYPGTCADGGYLTLSKNFIVNFKGYNVNEDGSPGDLEYLISYDSYTVKDNLPVDGNYTSFYANYTEDADGNILDYTDHGTLHWGYISGCNQ